MVCRYRRLSVLSGSVQGMEFETFTTIATAVDHAFDGSPAHDSLFDGPVDGPDGRIGYCAGCAADTVFEQPVCQDGHGDLCPEWVCTDCGLAVAVPVGDYDGLIPVATDSPTRRPARIIAA